MRAWQIVSDGGIDALHCAERDIGAPGHGEVKIKVSASAINYRDLSTIKDPVSRGLPYPTVPNSDAVGVVMEVGPGVIEFKAGDRVASCFFQRWQDGPCTPDAMASALGGTADGVLAEDVILSAGGVVEVPSHLTDAEAATLPCAGLTAWNAIMVAGETKPGDTVLLLGTGGVSIFALQFAKLAGARTIITSSSDEKLARARELGATETINYRATPDWDKAVLDFTDGAGADLVVEVGGADTLQKSVPAVKVAGRIAMIGVLTGGMTNPALIMRRSQRLQGIYVGSRRMFADMNRAIAAHQLRPVIDQTFEFEAAQDAYHTMQSASHFGKLVITM
jgi:NADPH:quinone reductase-like Zn-dependent oxidoreductase